MHILATGSDRKVHYFDALDGTKIRDFEVADDGDVHCISYQPKDHLVCTGKSTFSSALRLNSKLLLTRVATKFFTGARQKRILLEGGRGTGGIETTCISLLAGGDDRSLRLWGYESGECIAQSGWHADIPHCVCFSPDGNLLVSGGNGGVIHFWHISEELLRKSSEIGI